MVIIWSFDRLSRCVRHFLQIVDQLRQIGKEFVSHEQSFDTTTAMGKFTLTMFAALAQLEREVIRERVQAGIDCARLVMTSTARSQAAQTYVLNLFRIALVIALALPTGANSQVWRGTAPFCEGKCLAGERELARSSSGDGSRCITGSKALCQGANTPAACRPLQSNTECKGVVMICDNGYYTQRTNVPEWHSCAPGILVGLEGACSWDR